MRHLLCRHPGDNSQNISGLRISVLAGESGHSVMDEVDVPFKQGCIFSLTR